MSLTYRTTGAWGAGTGSNLVAAQVDGNFYDLDQRIDAIASGPSVVGLQTIAANGSQVIFTKTDGSTNTFTMPIATMTWRGAWTTTQTYAANDVIGDPVSGSVYLVMIAHVAAATFNPSLLVGSANVYRKMIEGVTVPETITTQRTSAGAFVLTLDSARRYYRIQETGDIFIGIPSDALVDLPINCQIEFGQWGGGALVLDPHPDVTINVPENLLPMTRGYGAVMAIKKIGANEWDVVGLLAEA